MTNTTSGTGFHITPEAIPSLQKAFQTASTQLDQAIAQVKQVQLTKPAMGDPPSGQFKTAFTQATQQQSAQLDQFKQKLEQVMQSLGEIQRAYDHHEQTTAQNLTSQLGS